MLTHDLPSEPVMRAAFFERDPAFDGLFVTGVRTTGIFCRPTCPARKPRPEHLAFFRGPEQALIAGFRPCKRCKPLQASGVPPSWLRPLLDAVEADPGRRWTDNELRTSGFSPVRVRRWFKAHHGMTFQAYDRARRLGAALARVREGSSVGHAAFDAGYESLSGFQEAFRQYFGQSPTRLEASRVLAVGRFPTPLGLMVAAATERELVLLEFADRRMLPAQVRRVAQRLEAVFVPQGNPVITTVEGMVGEYFRRERAEFDVKLLLPGTDFQQTVWQALLEIPYGETRSYAEVARSVGRPSAVRAVGRANGMNGLAIVVPCHRVVGSDGQLVGYGGGVWRKRWLLDLERAGAGDLSAIPPS